jgi:hypothetical protein
MQQYLHGFAIFIRILIKKEKKTHFFGESPRFETFLVVDLKWC